MQGSRLAGGKNQSVYATGPRRAATEQIKAELPLITTQSRRFGFVDREISGEGHAVGVASLAERDQLVENVLATSSGSRSLRVAHSATAGQSDDQRWFGRQL